ncbi:hypothetical protein [Methylorubrum thiocyanatum]
MTGPVTTEALVEGLRTSHLAAIDACLRASETTGEVPQGLRLREREAAAALISTLLAALQQVTAERDEDRAEHARYRASAEEMWETAKRHGGRMLAEKRRADVAEASLATATSELARLRAEGEAKDRALKIATDALTWLRAPFRGGSEATRLQMREDAQEALDDIARTTLSAKVQADA